MGTGKECKRQNLKLKNESDFKFYILNFGFEIILVSREDEKGFDYADLRSSALAWE